MGLLLVLIGDVSSLELFIYELLLLLGNKVRAEELCATSWHTWDCLPGMGAGTQGLGVEGINDDLAGSRSSLGLI